MSQHNTMTSNVSDMISQQRSNLQHLQNLQQHTRSMTSTDYASYYNMQQQQQLQQQAAAAQQQAQTQTQTQATQQQVALAQAQAQAQLAAQQQQMKIPPSSPNPILSMTSDGTNQSTLLPQMIAQQQAAAAAAQQQQQTPAPLQQGRNSLTNTSIKSKARNSIQDPRSPLVVLIPTSAQPTDILAARFAAWRNIIRSILTYLTETASIQDEIVRQQLRLSHAIQFPFFSVENQSQPSSTEDKNVQKFFLPLGNGSIQDLPTILNQYHGTLASAASRTSKELTNEVIPRLEDLRRDLLVKIKEIKSLQSDFKNSCSKELQETRQDMKQFVESLKETRYNGTPKQDPFLTKIILDKQIKKQLIEENFLHEAFDNLQTSGAELEKVVVMEIQNALTIYARLLGQESQLVFDILISKLDVGFFNKDPQFEWENFIARDDNFISPNLPMRKLKEIVYKYQYDPMTYEIHSGYLERRSKFLKSYSRGFYVLTPNFLHEFKTADRKKDLIPVMSLALNECTVAEHSKKGSSENKLVLHAKQNGLLHKGHNWVFKTDSYESMMTWFDNLKLFTSLTSSTDKLKYIVEKFNLETDGKPKIMTTASPSLNSPSATATLTKHKSHTQQTQDSRETSTNLNSNNGVVETSTNIDNDETVTLPNSTPKLDNATNTNTTSSIPDTNDSQIRDNLPNFYIETVHPGNK
ncbi:Phosphoinositide PI4,5P(2) binding protein [Maudiozyma exigua]|uniref:Phosphoinositide PI4,5P(2) binding protein n=1 Tax=Maudiozyma exigua TaxID=34358 RepID=A0A9P7BDD0_MAUEX|nr:Phosphoinositide PI4,5P(2) binding protein [Kazachstania exigua]